MLDSMLKVTFGNLSEAGGDGNEYRPTSADSREVLTLEGQGAPVDGMNQHLTKSS